MHTGTHAYILAGGAGTRLRSLFPDTPKALVPVAGRPFLEWQLHWLAAAGVASVRIAAGHRGRQIARWIKQSSAARRMRVAVDIEPHPLGTGGGLHFAARVDPPGEPFLVVNGDTLLPRADVAGFIAGACPDRGAAVAAVRVSDASRFGLLEIDADSLIRGFREKPSGGAGAVNAGVYLVHPAVLALIPESEPCSLEEEIFPLLSARGRLAGRLVSPPLLDIGTPDGLRETDEYLRRERHSLLWEPAG